MNVTYRHLLYLTVMPLVILASGTGEDTVSANEVPVANAGLPRYAATDPVQLDGSGSHDPDHSGPLAYAWTQMSRPPVTITGADTATPTVSGFAQTNAIQECTVELVVDCEGRRESAAPGGAG